MAVKLLTIGEFARLARLSQKALRLYDELGLLPPAKVEYIGKQPTLEDVFFAVVGDRTSDATPSNQ